MRGLRIAVIGAGHMGRRHAEKVVQLAGAGEAVGLAGIADLEAGRARRAAEELGTRWWPGAGALLAAADAAIVAVPAVAHFDVVHAALEAGLDVLVEKPIAAELDQAEALLALAARRGLVLQVGHQEWFNPAVRAVRELIRAPGFIEAQRVGPFNDRATDVDVVRDLMIHDLEIVQQLLGEEPLRVDAVGVPVVTGKVDVANVRLEFPGGCVASLTASRVARWPARRLRVFEREAAYSLDFLAQSALVHRRMPAGVAGLDLEELKGEPEDTLLAQLRDFLSAIRRRETATVTGIAALRTAMRVIRALPPVAGGR